MTEAELIERFFDSREDYIAHRDEAMREHAEWIRRGEPEYVPPSDENLSHEVESLVMTYDNMEDFIRKEILPDLAHTIGYVKTTIAGGFAMGAKLNYGVLELTLRTTRHQREQLRIMLGDGEQSDDQS